MSNTAIEYYIVVANPDTVTSAQPLPTTGCKVVGRPDDNAWLVCHVADYRENALEHLDGFTYEFVESIDEETGEATYKTITVDGCVDCLKTIADVYARFPELAGTVESSWTDEEGVEHVDELPRLVRHHYLGCKSFEE